MKLDVFGKEIQAEQVDGRWALSLVGPEGKHRPLHEILVPESVQTEEDLIAYLNDIYHESSSPDRPTVRRIE